MFESLASGTIVVTALPIALIAVFFAVRALSSQRQVRATRAWPTVDGRVLSSGVEARRSRSGSGHSTSFYPAVVYEYVVNGQRYMNNVVNPGQPIGIGFRGMVEKKVARYPVGNAVPVYYNPQNPGESVLETSATGANRVMWFIVAFIVLMLICTLVFTVGMMSVVDKMISPFG
ncbi:MAG: DUF3592 domain-containing protein [Chloroflexi bacterium]|nr:DUF3592 domain-containing protein [Chloroflexota bacterium]